MNSSGSGLKPKFVLFVCFFAYLVAKDAQDTWIGLDNADCFFVGPIVEEKAEAVFFSHAVPAWFVHEYLFTSVRLLFHEQVQWGGRAGIVSYL